MNTRLLGLAVVGLSWVSGLVANIAPTVVIQSAAMRAGTTYMDVVYRVDDPDDATVKVRTLAFVDGERSFAKVLRPVTFVENTASNVGDTVTTNADHTLTWNVGADWNIDLGQVKFEVLARDGRGLLPFDWISIPAAGGNPAVTVSKNSPTDAEVLDALFWQFADGDEGLTVETGVLKGTASSGVFNGMQMVSGSSIEAYATPFVFKRMNLDPDDLVLANQARAGVADPLRWHAANRPYAGISPLVAWGANQHGQMTIPVGLGSVNAIASGYYFSLALKSDGKIVGWGPNWYGETTIPSGLSGVTAIAAGAWHSLALKSDGTVVGWGSNWAGQTTIPSGLSGVTAIAAGEAFSLALKGNGTVVGWGQSDSGQTTPPIDLSNVIAIAAGGYHGLALKSDGTVEGWGPSNYSAPPVDLSGVTAIAAGYFHSLALKSDGTVVGWGGGNSHGEISIPVGLTGVIAIAAGYSHSLALKSDGSVVAWGSNFNGLNINPITVPSDLSGVTALATGPGANHVVVLKAKAP